jgi:CRISPR/Cas system endoribonuclease Cas6 (RAMP superfamily)
MSINNTIRPFIIQTMVMKLSEKESIQYLYEKGFKISRDSFYRIKRSIQQSKFDRLSSIAKSKFKAKPFSKKIEDKTVRCLEFEQKYLDRIKSIYDIPGKIEIKQKVTPVTPVTLVTLYTGIQVRLRNNIHTEITPKDKIYLKILILLTKSLENFQLMSV